ncbi:MAG: Gfo/Idh/MocA family oxidoreductase [Planctomycetes bacterium]|nr:Gfo/Idh/MocA family oxidoreductase [Planctomycetota bacterium]MBU4399292.1 Gfo/Idh/MocA family oxidoreductase [Planctomycetota bacterium]MCG2683712.1 Gfo/Idh/MocA family oxidoreductase [Planctomycetales bacterium]
MLHSTSNRRDFLRSTAAAGTLMPYWFLGKNVRADETTSKNDRPHVGAIGVGGRGAEVTQWAAKFGEIAAVCDVDRRKAERAKVAFGGKPEIYEDYRKLLERKDIDLIVNATPDHWHTAVNIAACKADKDVYAEKPLTLTIDEGKLLCKVVEQTGRIVQVGTQQRSEKFFQTAVELVRNGRIGKLKQVWVALPYFTTKGGPFPKQPVPPELNWDLYQGQAPEHDYCPQRTRGGQFRWWYEYAGGIITDWGNHHVDVAHWGMDCELSGPTSVEARGLFPNPPGPEYFNTPDRFFSRMAYPNGVEVLYFASLSQRARFGDDVGKHEETSPEQVAWLFGKDAPEEIKTCNRDGVMFIGEKGRVFVNRGGVYGKPVEELKENPLPADAWRAYPSDDHMADFFECVKTRKQPVAPVQVEHRTITACHLTNISLRLNRKIAWDPEKQRIVGDDEADAWQKRRQRAPYVVNA